MRLLYEPRPGKSARAVIFISGSGTNAEKLLESATRNWDPVLIVSDRAECNAQAIAERFHLPFALCDIRKLYRDHGLKSIALTSDKAWQLRDQWTDTLREIIAPYHVDFGILAGFVPLSNIVADFPCLNVHPGDLTCEIDGVRILAGLHHLPVKRALLLNGDKGLRSSVILAQPCRGANDVDGGLVLGISTPVKPDWLGFPPEEVVAGIDWRSVPGKLTGDLLSQVAAASLEKLKYAGDHVVFPATVEHFAAGDYARESDDLYFRTRNGFSKVRTVEYGPRGLEHPMEEEA
ncbi:MAG: formyltransferase family protein [Victivallaceae bacterium]|nr:formyltransferase family protein [Victivallaceae bacterium]